MSKEEMYDDSQMLTAEDLFRGGDNPYTPLEIPELTKGGKPGVVYLRHLPAGDVLNYVEMGEKQRNKALLDLIAKAVVTSDGKPVFDREQVKRVREISVLAFRRITEAVVSSIGSVGAEEGEGSGGTDGEGSSTASPSN